MKRVLLTGGTGFIGQTLLRDYAGSYRFVVPTSRETLDGLVSSSNIEYAHLAYDDSDGLHQALAALLRGCDAVVHLGFARPLAGRAESFADYVQSLEFSEALFDEALAQGISNIAFASSCSVYGHSLPSPHVEVERPEPVSLYASAKLVVEDMARLRNDRGGAAIKSLRIAHVLGNGEYQGTAALFLKKALSGEVITLWGNGTEARKGYVYVRDAARAFMTAIEDPDASGVFNIGSGEVTTFKDLAEMLLRACGRNPEACLELLPEKRVSRFDDVMSIGRAEEVLDWRPKWTIEDALKEMVQQIAQ